MQLAYRLLRHPIFEAIFPGLARYRMAVVHRSHAVICYILLVAFLLGAVLISLLSLWEMKIDIDHDNEWKAKSTQVQPFYWWQFLTHDGRDIGYEHKGPLRLALHPYAIYANLPNQRSEHFSTDEHGFRGNGLGQMLTGKRRIVLVGGSTAFGTGLENDGETVAAQLGQRLDAEVINAAVIGHGSGQELTYLLTELVDLRPDLVIALDGWNDYYKRLEVSDPRLLGMNGFDEIEDRLVASARVDEASLFDRARSLPHILFPRVSARVRHSRIGRWAGWAKEHERHPPPLDLAVTRYVENLTKMHKMGHAFSFQFLAVMQPDVGRGADYRKFRVKAESLLMKEKIWTLNLGDREEFLSSMFLDTMHLNGEGHALMADLIARTIQDDRAH